jgi:hypothetical protein
LCGCENWSLALKKNIDWECLRRIIRPKREEVEGGWRRLQNVELHNLNASPSVVGLVK